MRRGRSLPKCWRSLVAASLLAAAVFAGQGLSAVTGASAKGKGAAAARKSGAKGKAASKTTVAAPKTIKVDLDSAVKVEVEPEEDLKPTPFKTADGKSGWVVRIPGGRPIATPAYAAGMLYVGGGYGSNEFYAFDARTGKLRWQIDAGDDGPSAAVVEDGLVAFNTESCTLVVVEAKTGKLVWEEWLGDPLMSQPAISKGRVYMAFPGEGPGDDEESGDDEEEETTPQARRIAKAKLRHKKAKPTIKPTEEGSHTLLCADLRTGRHIWEQRISGDVLSAPVVSNGKVYFTTFDGTSYALNANNGRVAWKKENAGTSAPVVVGSNVVITQKEQSGAKAYEGLKVLNADAGTDKDKRLLARDEAAYLGADKGGGVALKPETQASLDSSVGFGQAPAEAQLEKANNHLGVKTVVGGWAYQGSRAVYSKGRMINAQGRYLNSVNASDGRFAWRAEVSGEGVAEDEQVFSPPALGARFMYLSSAGGHLLSVNQQDGRVGFMYLFGEPMVFQPALAGGNVYVGTANGLLICLKTGNADADGWYAWGGNAQHNKNQ